MEKLEIILNNYLMSIGAFGYILSCFLIIIESIIPILPLSVFITLLFYKFGFFVGLIICYSFTIIGSYISYKIFNGKLRYKFEKFVIKKNKSRLDKVIKTVKNIKFIHLCLLISLPFTPQFLINISSGLVNMDKRKYISSLFIGKIFLVLFWGFVGTSIISSFKNPKNIILICILMFICFIVSNLVNKKFNIDK